MKSAPRRERAPTLLLALILTAGMGPVAQASSGALAVSQLRCEYLENPLGIDAVQPRLSWIVESKQRSQRQIAYQILVSSTEAKLKANTGDLWDTGQVPSDETIQISYAGKPLTSHERCFWKVRVWDAARQASEFSEPASWEMGLLSPQDWAGRWIGLNTDTNSAPAPMLRRAFTLGKHIKQARVYVCGLGYYELHINGKKIGDHCLDPGYTRYDKRALYVTYDVTGAVQQGENAIGVILGNGWYNVQTRAVWNFHKAPWRAAPSLYLQLRVEYADGYTDTLVTDKQWKASTGPIVFNSIYGGETYDARLEKPGWDTPDFKDSGWASAQEVAAPQGRLAAQMMPPIKADTVIKPIWVNEPKPGVFVFDMGQNFAGYAELNVRGPAGTKVVMRYGERIHTNGTIDRAEIEQHVLRDGSNQLFQTDTYILKGAGQEAWHSRFVYHGFQYVEVTGFPGRPTLDNLRGVFLHSAVPAAGEFECSDPLLNRIWSAARWSYLSNLQGIPTDCPHREKNGWTGDAHLAAEQGLLNFAPAAVYEKWINDLADEQRPSGELPGIVPTSGWGYEWGNGPAWDSALLLIPFYLYEYCGDAQALRSHYASLKRYVDYLTSKARDGIVDIGLNDWAPFKTTTPADITSTAYYYRDARIVVTAAGLLNNEPDALQYAELAAGIKQAFNLKFYHPDNGLYGNGSQTSLSCALYQGLADPDVRPLVMSNLVANIEQRRGHIDTGILGAKYLLNALTDNGRADVACRIATQRDLPSWGWWLEQGASTLWEQWDGGGSRNHIMFGDISAWLYKALAGINPDPAAPGFKHFIVRPNVVGGLTSARASYNSVRGLIVSEWHTDKDGFHLAVTIPANTSATVSLPTSAPAKVKEGKWAAASEDGIKLVGVEEGRTHLEVVSGTYEFDWPL
ncbi:MAG TPA: glycoside hydrolase family 78 protein [Candidatus Acidoferrum sp.]|nr:glycoside hydrolase family 78 protein [Candidatus Acidoferrum sp.]